MNGVSTADFFFSAPLAPWGEVKKSKIINFSYNVNFNDFILNFVCVLTNERYIVKHIEQDFIYHLCHAPGWGAQGANFFSNMVMWHIKLTGLTSRRECK